MEIRILLQGAPTVACRDPACLYAGLASMQSLPLGRGRIPPFCTRSVLGADGFMRNTAAYCHGSRADCPPETHGGATPAAVYLDSTDLPDEA